MQAIRQRRSVTIPIKTAVKAMRRFPSTRLRVNVAPITRPLDQLTHVPKWTSFLAVEAAAAHAVWFVIARSRERARYNRSTNDLRLLEIRNTENAGKKEKKRQEGARVAGFLT